jgi:predicted MPP superfamily phosphohydrolase
VLPHQELQLVYAGASLAMTAVLWWGSGRFIREERWFLRAAVALCVLGAVGVASQAVLRHVAYGVGSFFIAVAITFYSAGLWLPAMLLGTAIRGRGASPRKRAVAVLVAAAALAVALDALLLEPNRLVVREETVPLAAWPAGTQSLRVAHLSDIQTVGPCDREQRALEILAQLAPDLIVVTGDYVAGPFFDIRPAEADARAFLASLARIAPTVVVAGHCEDEDVRTRLFSGLGLVYLEDSARDFDFGGGRKVRVIGLDPFQPDLRLPREPRPPGSALLVATHPPDVTTKLVGMGVDLHLAGHTHGGQIALPFFGPPVTMMNLPRKYARGFFRFEDHWLDVCAGLGMEGNHAPRIRFLCPPEIVMLTLTGAGKGSPP